MAPKPEWQDKDYYADLGVSKTASEADIKKAYRKLARENHPDSHPGDSVREEKFKKIAEAYDVIGDETKRREYDEFKAMVASGGFGGVGYSGGFRSGQNINFEDLSDIFGGASRPGGGFASEGSLGDIFGGLFNRSGGAGGGARQARRTRGQDVETDITLSFKEAALGTQLPIQLTGDVTCSACQGKGSASGTSTTCATCDGKGLTSENRGAFGLSAPCQDCGGTGTRITDPCIDCQGTGTTRSTRSITVRIPAGITDGQKVRIAGKGEAGPHGAPAGDLFVRVQVRPDKVFNRKDDDLQVTVPVSFAELALGAKISVPTLDSPVTVKIPAGTPSGRVLRVRGRGIARKGGGKGDLLVELSVQVPTTLSDEARVALETYAAAEKTAGFDPRAGWAGA